MKKFLAVLLGFITAFTAFGCFRETGSASSSSSDSILEEESKYPETDEYILRNGASEYKIVIANNASTAIQYAANELQYFFEDATDITLPIVSDAGLTYTTESKYLSIGENAISVAAEIELDKKALGTSGVRLITEGNSLFFCGGSEEGTLYAVYTWLSEELDYEFYYDEIWDIQKGVRNLKLRNYDLTDIPDFEVRRYSKKKIHENVSMSSRLRVSNGPLFNTINLKIFGKQAMSDGVLTTHYIKKADYFEDHPGWYSPTNGHACLTASSNMDGVYNAEEYEALINELAWILEESFKADPIGTRVVFGGADEGAACTCLVCQKERDYYGEYSGSFIKLCNDVRALVDAWMESEEGKPYAREWTLEPLIYAGYFEAPVKVDENGEKYPTIRCADGVIPWWAPLNTELLLPIEHEDNANNYNSLYNWQLCSDSMTGWLYDTNYKDFMLHLDSHKTVIQYFKIMKELDCAYMSVEGQVAQSGLTTGWDMVQTYVLCKAMWDVNVDVQELIANWFKAAYGPAADIMTEVYQESRINLQMMSDNGFRRSTNAYRDQLKPAHYNTSLLLRWLDMYDKALETVDKEGGTAIMKKMIRAERVSTLYTYLELNYTSLTAANVNAYATQFFDDCAHIQLQCMREATDLTNTKTLKAKYALYGYKE